MVRKNLLAFLSVLLIAFPVFAWDGYDSITGNGVYVDRRQNIRVGRHIYVEFDGNTQYCLVEYIERFDDSIVVTVADEDGVTHDLIMDR